VVAAVGTTLVDSGLLSAVVSEYEAVTGRSVSVVAVSSRSALHLASGGEADVIITHHPEAEAEFLADHAVLETSVVFASDFVLLAPIGVDLDGMTLAQALAGVAASGSAFVARGDGSGTSAYEEAAWAGAGIDPIGADWYTVTGLGMGESLLVASDRNAVTLSERGAYLQAADTVDLVPVALTDLHPNPYRVTLISEVGRPFYEWLASPDGVVAVEQASIDLLGYPVFHDD
jgi:tungstate transport system substrate-binding protein